MVTKAAEEEFAYSRSLMYLSSFAVFVDSLDHELNTRYKTNLSRWSIQRQARFMQLLESISHWCSGHHVLGAEMSCLNGLKLNSEYGISWIVRSE